MERRSMPLFDTSDALKHWLDFYKKSNSLNSYSLSDQLINECLSELNQNVLERLLPRQCRISDEITSNTSTVTSPITFPSIDELMRHKSNSYSRIEGGLHQISINQDFNSQDFTELFFIEESWEQIVKSSSKMTRQQQKRQSAIWEFIHTEANYLKYLRSIIDYYLSPFLEIHEYLFENLDVEWIFSNIEEIFKANIKLWLQYLIEPLNEIRRNGNAFTPVTFKSAITHIPDLLSVYKQYYMNLSRCRSYTQEAIRQSVNFCTFLEWADQQGHDHREPLWDQMTKPTTRLTQYRLIMESIRNNCSNSIEEQEISEMLKSISEFIEGINQQMTETKTWESLEMLTSKLIYDDLYENGVEDYTQLISDHTKFKFSLLSPIKLPFPIILFNEQNYIYQQTIPSCTKSLALLRNRRLSGSSLFTLK
ncbi:Pleckstrin homology domain-containing family G member 5 [Schistosoma japonicum]|uniref:Pleckstrin homology domain-containing family G member 5 n=1 Tax=Schistosoma japonicum TaxID=6182 RepID=A0A4Z2DCL2_SCHJA|nr:Pleckstrin homology domain-containing family G member 5 [Schistosoma japonicum]